ncbi:MAG: DUF5916 domain-containing protein [Vicinamibacterales bacterium]
MCLAAATLAFAQPPASRGPAPSAATRRATAARTPTPLNIDGVLDESVWQQATPMNDFIQSEPSEGQAATERTEVRILFDDKAIYVGVTCYDSDPEHLVTLDSRRDSALSGQDSFQMILDTYHDRQNGFIFGTTPLGLQYDAQVRNEGETIRSAPTSGGGGNTGGAGGGVNVNWDGSWDVKTHVGENGWTAEFMIPLRTLRYGTAPQTWGVNFSRTIERKRESVYWSPVLRIYSLARLSSAGELGGLSVPAPRDFKLMPYASGSSNRSFLSSSQRRYDRKSEFGVDAKIGVTSSTTLDLTYNTDFAQVEVDEQQINLTRFNLLFPEKRPFFLENRGLFAVGRPGEIDLFFSRKIGISDSGELLPIAGGARFTGKASGLNIGLLDMQTEETGNRSANNFSAARVSKDLPNRSNFGAIVVNRLATGDLAGNDNWNRTYGVDGRYGIGEATTVTGFAARTQTPGATGRQHAFSSAFDFRSRQFEAQTSFTEVGEDFDPQVGFLERTEGYRQVTGALRRHVRTPTLAKHGLREWEPHTSYESYWGFDGMQETALLHIDSRLDFENGYTLGSTALNIQWEGLRTPFEVYPGVIVPAGMYRSPYFLTMGNTDRRKWISASMSANIGGFLSGTQQSYTPQINIRQEGRLTSSVRWARNDIRLPQGNFKTNLVTTRVTYNFSTRVNASTLIQYNDRTKRWSTNLRFNWLRTAANGLYVVYNDTEGFNGLGPVNRSFIVKYVHLFDILH